MNNARDILLKILAAIDYSDNREAFADEFIKNIHLQALLNLIQSLPAEKQAVVKHQLSSNQDDPHQIAALLQQHFSQQELDTAIENAAKDAVTEYIKAITPTLSAAQKEKLLHVMEEFGQAHAA